MDFEYVDLNIKSFGLNCTGGDFAYLVNYFADIIEEMIRENVIGVLSESTMRSIEEIINLEIKQTPEKNATIDDNLQIDLSLVGSGIVVSDKWLAIPLDGTFHPI